MATRLQSAHWNRIKGVAVMAAQANSRRQAVASNWRGPRKLPSQGQGLCLTPIGGPACVKVFAALSDGRAYQPLHENIRDKPAIHKLSAEIAKVKTGVCAAAQRAWPKARDGNVKAKAA